MLDCSHGPLADGADTGEVGSTESSGHSAGCCCGLLSSSTRSQNHSSPVRTLISAFMFATAAVSCQPHEDAVDVPRHTHDSVLFCLFCSASECARERGRDRARSLDSTGQNINVRASCPTRGESRRDHLEDGLLLVSFVGRAMRRD